MSHKSPPKPTKQPSQLVCPECRCEAFELYDDATAKCCECGMFVDTKRGGKELPPLH